MKRWNLWIWNQPSWRVLASYETHAEAYAAARYAADPPETWVVSLDGSRLDLYMRGHCTERRAHRWGR